MYIEHVRFLGTAFEDRLELSKAEIKTLRRAGEILSRMRLHLEQAYGVDEVLDVPPAEAWVLAESYLAEALDNTHGAVAIKLPVVEEAP